MAETLTPAIYFKQGKIVASTEFLKPWDKNPRFITEENFERLKADIKGKKQFKPILIMDDGTVLGGNMRIRAYKELKVPEVWVSVVSAKRTGEGLWQFFINNEEDQVFQSREAGMAHYNTRDNQPYGGQDKQMTVELFEEVGLPFDAYALNFGEPENLEDVYKEFAPSEEDNDPTEKDAKRVKCPECNYEFEV